MRSFRGRCRRLAVTPLLLASCGAPEHPAAPPAPARPDAAAEAWSFLAQRYDADGDGRIARAEYSRGDDLFARLDRDGDGAITPADAATPVALPPDFGIPLIAVRLAVGREATAAPVPALVDALAKLDRDGNGRVSAEEFHAVLGNGGPVGVDGFATLRAGIDADGDELLSRPELERWFTERDQDHDGQIALREPERGGPPLATGWFEPAVRTPAPDFTAQRLDGDTPVTLRALQRGRPIALIFGSFT
jgi:Ca2+-binding EF-hand superfamily protein